MFLRVEVGDSVVWKPKDKGHNVEFIIGPDAIELPKKSRINQEFTYTFEKSGVYFYQCTPHKSMGMIAVIIVGDDLTNLDQVKSVRVFGKVKESLKRYFRLYNKAQYYFKLISSSLIFKNSFAEIAS